MARPKRPDPLPLESNDLLLAFVLTAAWAAALISVVALRAAGSYDVGTTWVWVCAAGVGLGIIGTPLVMTKQQRADRDVRRGLRRTKVQPWPNGSPESSSSATDPGPGSGENAS